MASSTDALTSYLVSTPNIGANPDEMEATFNNGVREITILCLTGFLLCYIAYLFLNTLFKQVDDDDEDDDLTVAAAAARSSGSSGSGLINVNPWQPSGCSNPEDETVYQISYAICCFSLAVSAGSTLLLPISSISNEVLHRYPDSWYIKWLNASLIQGIWNLIFMLSNLCLFVLLPFAYLFCESEGFFGYKKGLLARAKETLLTLLLLSLVIMGLVYIITAIIDWDQHSFDRLINLYSYLPMLYSWVSFFGVLMLLLCTPLGFARLFTVVGDLVVRPKTAKNLEDEYLVTTYEEESLKRRMNNFKGPGGTYLPRMGTVDEPSEKGEMMIRCRKDLEETSERREQLNKTKKTSMWWRAVGYPLFMMGLFTLTFVSLVSVVKNVTQIVAGFKSLPAVHEESAHTLGISSLTSLGAAGVLVEVVLITYLFVTSLVGLYTIPLFRNIRPKFHCTTLTQIILNCGLYVILSSALPLQVKILGITNFDLLGSFGKMKWLGSFYIVLLYNAIFALSASLCLFNKFTARVRHEILKRVTAFVTAAFTSSKSKLIQQRGNNAGSSSSTVSSASGAAALTKQMAT